MSRAAIGLSILLAIVCLRVSAQLATDPHLDVVLLPDGCSSCHVGHGASDTPMLDVSQKQLCLECHGVGAASARLAPATRLGASAFGHPIDEHVFSRHEGRVTCTSCHSAHRGMPWREDDRGSGGKARSPRDASILEHELCESCHGALPGGATRPGSVAERISASSASYHPVQAPANGRSPSVRSELAGREINCTDCHGSDAAGERGLHSSAIQHILVRSYASMDGESESARTYALCYGCHDRESILRGDSFPLHRLHVVDARASCSTCHDPHGSVGGRALSRLSGTEHMGRLVPSIRTGLLSFDSPGPGSGACHVSCHGRDHGPQTYGAMELFAATGAEAFAPLDGNPRRRPSRLRPAAGAANDAPPTRVRDVNP